MATNILTARERTTEFFIRVHIDTSKTIEGGAPDPAYVMTFRYSNTIPDGLTRAQYLQNIRQSIRQRVIEALDRLKADGTGTALGIENEEI